MNVSRSASTFVLAWLQQHRKAGEFPYKKLGVVWCRKSDLERSKAWYIGIDTPTPTHGFGVG
jgi:hypothetical protein